MYSCKKMDLQTQSPEAYTGLQRVSTVEMGGVVDWLHSKEDTLAPHRSEIIAKVLDNADFENMYSEEVSWSGENIIVVPLRPENFSQHTEQKYFLQYLVLMEDTTGMIRRGEIVIFYPKNTALEQLPENSFSDLISKSLFPVDGQMDFITLDDYFQGSFEFDDNRLISDKSYARAEGGSENCTRWWLNTITYTYADGEVYIDTDSEYLGETCTSCPPNQLCDELEGSLGGGNVEEPTQKNAQVSFIVKNDLTQGWTVTAKYDASGYSYSDPNLNKFDHISHNSTGITHSGASGHPLHIFHGTWTDGLHRAVVVSPGVTAYVTASGVIEFTNMNSNSQYRYRPIENYHYFSAKLALR